MLGYNVDMGVRFPSTGVVEPTKVVAPLILPPGWFEGVGVSKPVASEAGVTLAGRTDDSARLSKADLGYERIRDSKYLAAFARVDPTELSATSLSSSL